MEKTIRQNIRLGILVIAGTALFILTVYLIGNRQRLFGNTLTISAYFKNINGLILGNSVRYSGVDAGTVNAIEMMQDKSIRVEMAIDKNIMKFITKDAVATIGSDGLVGNMIVNIIPGKDTEPPVVSGDTITTFSRTSTDDLLNTFNVTNDNAAKLSANLLKITEEILNGEGVLGTLLKDPKITSDLKETLNNLKTTSRMTTESMTTFNNLLHSLQKKNSVVGVLQDSLVASQIKGTVSQVQSSVSKLDQVLENLNATILNLKDGKGSINYLSNDPKLVNKIDRAVTNLDSTLRQTHKAGKLLNENLEALKHNIFFRGYFKKQEKAEEKEK
ncbi:MAG: MCE family protein [Saprospiraceae bacterium]|nr:MCE family protein [Candidatus Vicinibacter affinis]MBP6174000.1 MCE family protein [Saprospiraceae bacterium]MBK7798814.1 MCE family protein [Candidatus Vicinibacter affinis]MBK9640813.1 MCE family protein [Candidatus Vicinibacter affinis]MBP6523179.1 MCE family protein [Saprospiraceae bacterium]